MEEKVMTVSWKKFRKDNFHPSDITQSKISEYYATQVLIFKCSRALCV